MSEPVRSDPVEGKSVHPVDEILPLPKLFALGLQHVLVMYANAVAVPLILSRQLLQERPSGMAIVRLGRSHHRVGQRGAILEPLQVIPRPVLVRCLGR
jgi:hypothetical protein